MYYSLLFGGYVLASGIHSVIRYRRIMSHGLDTNGQTVIQLPDNSKGIVLKGYKKSIDMPIYLNSGNGIGVGIPIGGGDISESAEQIYSKVNDNLINYEIFDENEEVKHINKPERLQEVLEKYKIEDTAFKMTLPLQSIEYSWTKGPLALNGNISTDKSILALRYAFRKRYPLTFVALSIGAIWTFFDYDDFTRSRRRWYAN